MSTLLIAKLAAGGALLSAARAGSGLQSERSAPTGSETPPVSTVGGWCWPLPSWMGRAPCISDGPGPGKRDGGSRAHHGVDIDYRRARGTLTQFRPGTREASSGGLFFCPDGVNVLAAYDGTIWSVGTSDRGLQIVIDHGKPYATYYQHLRTTRWPELRRGAGGIRVKAGEVIGTVGNGHSPGKASASAFNHLHFEIWHAGGAESWIDPSAILAKARVVTL